MSLKEGRCDEDACGHARKQASDVFDEKDEKKTARTHREDAEVLVQPAHEEGGMRRRRRRERGGGQRRRS